MLPPSLCSSGTGQGCSALLLQLVWGQAAQCSWGEAKPRHLSKLAGAGERDDGFPSLCHICELSSKEHIKGAGVRGWHRSVCGDRAVHAPKMLPLRWQRLRMSCQVRRCRLKSPEGGCEGLGTQGSTGWEQGWPGKLHLPAGNQLRGEPRWAALSGLVKHD